MGVWLIFPFVLLDIAIFSYFFYRVCESTYAAEIITVDKDSVKFRSGIRKFGKSISFKRPCYFIVHPTPSKNHLPIFSISDDSEKARGTSYEVSTHLPRHNMLPDDRTRMLKSTNGGMNSVVSVTVATVLMCSWWLHFGIATSCNKVTDVPNHSCFIV